MTITDLSVDVFTYSLLHKVNTILIEWDLEPLTGKALFSKHHSVAYLELKMYSSKQNDAQNSQVIWNIPENPISIVHPNYKSDIEKSLVYFVSYISALKGESIFLTFEINDATFDSTSTRNNPFEKATIYAIINCFGKDILQFREETVETLKANITRFGSNV